MCSYTVLLVRRSDFFFSTSLRNVGGFASYESVMQLQIILLDVRGVEQTFSE